MRQSLDTYSGVPAEKGTAKIIDNIERDNEVRSKKRLSLKRNSSFFELRRGLQFQNRQKRENMRL